MKIDEVDTCTIRVTLGADGVAEPAVAEITVASWAVPGYLSRLCGASAKGTLSELALKGAEAVLQPHFQGAGPGDEGGIPNRGTPAHDELVAEAHGDAGSPKKERESVDETKVLALAARTARRSD